MPLKINMQVYLDNAATTKLDPEVISVMQDFTVTHYGNPSSVHAKGREARVKLEKARKSIADSIGCKGKELIFTSGGTEANNAILKSVAFSGTIKRIISSPIEHHSVLDTLDWIKTNTSLEIVYLKVSEKGDIDLKQLRFLLAQNTPTLVSLMHGNNEIGNLLDLEFVGDLCKDHNALFHTDMVQTLGHLPISLSQLPIDYASASAHKVHGPKGVGFIYVNSKTTKLGSFLHGGAQERSIRAGTENGSGIIGMGKAYEIASMSFKAHHQYLSTLKKYFVKESKSALANIIFNGNSANLELSLPNIINVRLPGTYDETLLFSLDLNGVYVSEGSACSSGASEGSHVLAAISRSDDKTNNIRLSFSKFTTLAELDYAIKTISDYLD